MRNLNLKDYNCKVSAEDKNKPGAIVEVSAPYHVKASVLTLMFIPDLKLNGVELLKTNILAMKIEGCVEDNILLEDEEWARLKRAVDTHKGFGRNDVELVDRILNAVEIKSSEIKLKGKAK